VTERDVLRALISYHLEHQRPMMAVFLDEQGVAHQQGLIDADELKAPPEERLQAAADKLAAQYPREDVQLYLSTLLAQDPETWAGLAGVAVEKVLSSKS
jgi:hypothetical protein